MWCHITYWCHNNYIHFDNLTSVSCHYMQYYHGSSCVQMLISLETKSTPLYIHAFKTCRCTNMHYACPWNAKNNWFESDYNINILCDNKNVKFHCFNPRKKQPLRPFPVLLIRKHMTCFINCDALFSNIRSWKFRYRYIEYYWRDLKKTYYWSWPLYT